MIYLGNQAVGLTVERGSFDTPAVIPHEYERLLYLESTGSQCIDTGIHYKLSSELEIDGQYTTSVTAAYPRLCGTKNPLLLLSCVKDANYENTIITAPTGYYQFGNSGEKSYAMQFGLRFKTKINKNKFAIIVNNNSVEGTVGATSVSENATSTITLFCGNNQGTYENYAAGRIYEYKYSEDGILLRHMFPVKRLSDNELGMYDVVNNVFYTNAGTGTFIAGYNT